MVIASVCLSFSDGDCDIFQVLFSSLVAALAGQEGKGHKPNSPKGQAARPEQRPESSRIPHSSAAAAADKYGTHASAAAAADKFGVAQFKAYRGLSVLPPVAMS